MGRREPLDPLEHCQFATRAKPLVMSCSYRARDNPCTYCTRIERERREWAHAYEELCATETYYENLKRQPRSNGLFADWALGLYEEAGMDVERAIALIADVDEHEAVMIEVNLRMMPARNRGGVIVRWQQTIAEVEARRGGWAR